MLSMLSPLSVTFFFFFDTQKKLHSILIVFQYVKINSTSYTAVVMGDVDGDGRIRALDYIAVKRAYLGTIADLSDLSKEAIGITDGGRVRAIHYVMLKRAVMGNYDMNKDYACTPYVPGADESGWTSGWV